MSELPEDDKLLTMREAREYLRVGRSTIIRFMDKGMLEGWKVGNTWRFRLSDLKRLMVQRGTKGVG